MIRRLTPIGLFLWDFVVGDDWVGAAGVLALLVVAAVAAHRGGVNGWWLLPPGVVAVLTVTLARSVRALRPRQASGPGQP